MSEIPTKDEQIKEKMISYLELIENKPLQKDIDYVIEKSPRLFNLKTIKDENIVYSFLFNIHTYFKNIYKETHKLMSKTSTTNKRNKKENAIKGANAIIDYLDGMYCDNIDSSKIKTILRDFINNPDKYKNESITYTITKDNLRSELRKIIPNKSKEIEDFVKGLENFKI